MRGGPPLVEWAAYLALDFFGSFVSRETYDQNAPYLLAHSRQMLGKQIRRRITDTRCVAVNSI
jgi:hypothetical protein